MGWDTDLDPKKLPGIKKHRFDPPVLSMDDYVRFCARMRMEMSKNSLGALSSLTEGLPVRVPFKI